MSNFDHLKEKTQNQTTLDLFTSPQLISSVADKIESSSKPHDLKIPVVDQNIRKSSNSNSFSSFSSERTTTGIETFASFTDIEEEKRLEINENIKQASGEKEGEDKERNELKNLEQPIISLPKVIVTSKKTSNTENFNMDCWAEFQTMLKSNYLIIKSEVFLKEKLQEDVNVLLTDYNRLYLKLRENNERIRKRLDKEEFKEEDILKVLVDSKNDGLGEASLFIKKLLYLLYENPKIVATIVKNNIDSTSLKILEETLCNTFYEDPIAHEANGHYILWLLQELLKVEFEKAHKYGDLFRSENFANKILASFFKRNEYKRYMKMILKTPLILCLKDPAKIRLDRHEIEHSIEKRDRMMKSPTIFKTSELRSRFTTISDLSELEQSDNNIKDFLKRSLTTYNESQEQVRIPKFGKIESHKLDHDQKLCREGNNEKDNKDNGGFHIKFSSSRQSIMQKLKNKEIVQILEKSFAILKGHLCVLIQAIFDNLYSMPTDLRILCKLIHNMAKKKFPGLSEKQYNEILGNYIFRRWICPNFIFPEHNGILDDLHISKEETTNKLMEIAKVLQMIFNQSLYPENEIKSELNPFISEIIPSVEEYYKELISINENFIAKYLSTEKESSENIKARSICLSIEEIHLLCESIINNKNEIVTISPETVKIVERILFYDKEKKIFGDKIDSLTDQRLRPNQAFVSFQELIMPKSLVSNYFEEFDKIFDFSKNRCEKEKLILKVKHILKRVLLEIEDIKNLELIYADRQFALIDVLHHYQYKINHYEPKRFRSKDSVPLYISARYLISLLSNLDESYKINNYYKLYQEMLIDFNKVTQKLDLSIGEIKMQLLKAQETVKKEYTKLEEANQKKRKALKKAFVREFIRLVRIPLCVTSPSTTSCMVSEEKNTSKNKVKMLIHKRTTTFPEKVTIILRNEEGCLHERFALARELAANGVLLKRTHSKSLGNDRSSDYDRNAWDDMFNEKNYHCESIDEFITIFGNLPEVKETLITGEDHYGVGEALTFYYEKVNAAAKICFKKVAEDEYALILDEIENYITKRLYRRVFPTSETDLDHAFHKKCKSLDWVDFNHLEIPPHYRCDDMWYYASQILNEMNNKETCVAKLACIVECFKVITRVFQLTSVNEGIGGADETLPIMTYILLKACPSRIHSNLNFVNILRERTRMLAGEGYCFTQLKSAVYIIESLGPEFFKMDQEEFDKLIKTKNIASDFIETNNGV